MVFATKNAKNHVLEGPEAIYIGLVRDPVRLKKGHKTCQESVFELSWSESSRSQSKGFLSPTLNWQVFGTFTSSFQFVVELPRFTMACFYGKDYWAFGL